MYCWWHWSWNVLGMVSKLFYIKHFDWFIMMSSRILLVHLENYQISGHIIIKMVDNSLNKPMKFLMTSLRTNQNTLYRIIWRRSLMMYILSKQGRWHEARKQVILFLTRALTMIFSSKMCQWNQINRWKFPSLVWLLPRYTNEKT